MNWESVCVPTGHVAHGSLIMASGEEGHLASLGALCGLLSSSLLSLIDWLTRGKTVGF